MSEVLKLKSSHEITPRKVFQQHTNTKIAQDAIALLQRFRIVN
jgi:hypothetical protein